MADAIARAEALQEEAATKRKAAQAIDEERHDMLRDMENKAQRTAEDEALQIKQQMKKDMLALLVEKINNSERTPEEKEALIKALES